jgi:hypothetical protein
MVEWASWWNETIDRWRNEGLPDDLAEVTDISDHLGLDSLKQFWFKLRSDDFPRPPFHGAPIIHTPQDYDDLKKEGKLFRPDPFDIDEVKKWNELARQGKTVIWLTFEGFFWFPRTLFGIENHMYAFYDYPELMHRMNGDLVEYWLEILGKFTDISTPVFATIAEDMSYNHGPMLSKGQFDEFLAPYYKKLVPALKDRGIKVFVDSDGDIEPLIPWLKEVGVEGLLPLERMAGVDVNNIRKNHPDFLMIGAYDKTIMHKGDAALEAEFQRLMPATKSGGFIPSVDHQTPPGVSLEDYKRYVEIYRKYARIAADG